MGIIPYKYRDGQLDPWEQQLASAGLNLKVGMALKMSGGKLAMATAADAVEFISMEERDAATVDGQPVLVIAADSDTIYETSLSEQVSGISRGATYNIDSTGMMLASTTGGALKVIDYSGDQAGDTVRVQLVKPAAG